MEPLPLATVVCEELNEGDQTEMTTLRDVERLASTLDAANLDDTDRATLHAVFALAGQAVAGEGDEVSGFSIVYQMPGGAGGTSGFEYGGSVSMGDGSCFQSFQWGVGRAGADGGVPIIDY